MVRATRLRRRRRSIPIIAAALTAAASLTAIAPKSSADSLVWTGSGNDQLWSDTNNWFNPNLNSPHADPISGDTATFSTGGAGSVYLFSPQTLSVLQLTNLTNSYTFADTNTASPVTTLSVGSINASASIVTNTFAGSLTINESSAAAIQITPGSGVLDFKSAITAPQGLTFAENDGEIVLENSADSIGAVKTGGGMILATSPAALTGMSSMEFTGSAEEILDVVPTDGQSVSGLPNLTLDASSQVQIGLALSNPNLVPFGAAGLTTSTITYNSLTLTNNASAMLSTVESPYTLGITTLVLSGNGKLAINGSSLDSPRGQDAIGIINQQTTGATLTINGGGVTTISSNSARTGTTTICGGMVVLDNYKSLGTGTINVNSGTQDTDGWLDPGGALDIAASGAGFPTTVNVQAYAALGGNLTNAIYSGAGQNVTLANNAILFASSGSALPGQLGGHAVYWLGITNTASGATYSVGDGTASIYQGAALGAFTNDGGFDGTISDPFSQDLLIHVSGFTAMGQPGSVSNGVPTSAGTGPVFNSSDGVADITYDGTGSQLAYFAPSSGTATTINLTNSAASQQDSFVSLNTSGDVAANQTFNLQSGTLVSEYQSNDVAGIVNVDSGATYLHEAYAGETSGTFHVLSGGALEVTGQSNAPGSGATYQWDSGSIVQFFNSTVSTASAGSADQNWISPNSDIDVNYVNAITNSLSGVGIPLIDTRRITTDKGGILYGGSGLAPSSSAGPTDTFTFSAAANTILDIGDNITVASGQTLQFGTTSTWGPHNLAQNGTVSLSGNVNAQTLNVVAGTLQVNSALPATSNINNAGVFDMEGTSYVNNVTGAGNTIVGANGAMGVNQINQTSVDDEALLEVKSSGTVGSITGYGELQVDDGATFNTGGFTQLSGVVNNGQINVTGSGTIGGIIGNGTLTINNGARVTIAQDSPVSSQNGLTLNGTGTLDVTDNSLVITYAPNNGTYNPAVETAIRAELINGYDNGNWDGHGITSSVAQADAANPSAPYFGNSAVGYADNNYLGDPSIPNNSVLVMFTYYGDADLNGVVNLDDFSDWLAGFEDPRDFPDNWVDGDFLYEGNVNLDDFNVWLSSFQQDSGNINNLAHEIETSTLSASQQQELLSIIANVPEPGSLAMLAAGVGILLPRRRRRFLPH